MSKVLITGINGFIGRHIAERMLKEGLHVRGLIRKTSDLSFLQGMDIEYFYGDITQPESLPQALKGIDIVIHVAGLASDWGPYELFRKINVQGTVDMAREAETQKVKRFVHISTVAIYGFGHPQAVKESDPVAHTIFPYNESKREAEEWLFDFAKTSKMEVTAIRPGNVFGARDHTFMEKYLEALEQGKMAYVGGGKSKTCPTYIENLVDAVTLACFSKAAAGEAFFITDGMDIDWKTFTGALADKMKLKRPSMSVPYSLGYGIAWLMEMAYKLFRIKTAPLLTRYRISNGGKDYYFSIDKAREKLGYNPKAGFEEAVAKTVEWYQNRR